MKTVAIALLSVLISISAFGADLRYECTCIDSSGVNFQPNDPSGNIIGSSPSYFSDDKSKTYCIYPDTVPNSAGGYQGIGWTCKPVETRVLNCSAGDEMISLQISGDKIKRAAYSNQDWGAGESEISVNLVKLINNDKELIYADESWEIFSCN